MRFRHTAKFPVSPSNLKKFDGVPGSREGSQALCVLFWNFFRTSEKSAAAKRRCNTRGRVTEKENFVFRETFTRLTAINSSSQTQA